MVTAISIRKWLQGLAAKSRSASARRAGAEAAKAVELRELDGALYITCCGVASFRIDEKATVQYATGVLARARSVAAAFAERQVSK